MEVTVAHEFGHQYWYGMVATNEFEEPWLDEGINSYSESKVMGSLFGQNTSAVNARTLYASDAEIERHVLSLPSRRRPDRAPGLEIRHLRQLRLPSSMAKPPPSLLTLEGVVGEETLRQALRVYFMRYRFQHPTGTDFLHTVEEVSGRKDLEPYLDPGFRWH